MSKNRISTCTSDFGCLMNAFYVPDRIKDPFQSSSGIDVSPYEFNKYENFINNENFNTHCQNCGYNCPYNCPHRNNVNKINNVDEMNNINKCNNNMSKQSGNLGNLVNLVCILLIILIIIFLIYKLK
jgi:hypothetical protein